MTTLAPGSAAVELPSTALWVGGLILALLILGMLGYLLGRGRASGEARLGLRLGLRGLLSKELRSRSRGWRPVWLLTGYLGLLTLAVAGFLALISGVGGAISPTMGTQLFSTLAVGSVLLMAFITPALTVGAVSGERERRTLDLLLVTRASAFGLVGGKLLGSLFYILFLLAASLPAFALVYLFGGVPPLYLAMVLAVAAVTALAHAALGLLLSALLKRTLVASVVAYLVVLTLVVGLPFVSAVLGVAQQVQRSGAPPVAAPVPAYLYASPLVSLASVLPAGSPGNGGSLVVGLAQTLVTVGRFGAMSQTSGSSLARTVYLSSNPITGEMEAATAWAPWVYHFLYSGILTLLCLFIAAVALAPVKPWQRWRVRSHG